MVLKHSGHKNGVIAKSVLVSCLFIFLILSNFIFLHYNRKNIFDRLEIIAGHATEMIREELQAANIPVIKDKLISISKQYNLHSFELYGFDGSLVVRSGEGGVETVPKVFEEKNYGGIPYSTTYLHTHILLQDKRPYGYLFLYTTSNGYWRIFFVFTFALFLLGTFCVLTKRAATFQSTPSEGINPPDQSEALKTMKEWQEQAKIEREIICQQRDEALIQAKRKGEFLANMSHEIRTLLNGVIGVLSLLRKSNLEEERIRLLNTATRSADSLLLIIGDILDFSKIEAGKLVFENIRFNLRDVVEESISLFTDNALAKQIGLHCYLPTEIETNVTGDPTRLRQILTNFISNGIKFTEKGEVTLRVTLLERYENNQKLLFSVDDTGVGIEEGKISELFEMFTQADQTTTRKYGGSGLGLSVCKSLVELQNGEIGVKSKPGRGASFWFSLSFEITEEKSFKIADELRHKKIVYYDVCETCQSIVSQYLSECNLVIEKGDRSESVLHSLTAHREGEAIPDMVLVDISIVKYRLKDFIADFVSLYGSQVPKLYLLARYEQVTEEIRGMDISGIIYKPIRFNQLHEELTGGVDIKKDSQQDDLANSLNGTVLLVDDEPINLRVGEMILGKLGLEVELATNGKEAVERIKEKRYDYVLMDIQMPEMSGLEATEQIRAWEKEEGRKTQLILALTANVLPSIKEQCKQVGMQGYIAKPIKADILYNHLLPWSNTEDNLLDSEISKGPTRIEQVPIQGNKVWDMETALNFVSGDRQLLYELVQLFLERKPVLESTLTKALQSENRDKIGNSAHAIKGAVNHFAAGKCRVLAQTIEREAPYKTIDELSTLVEELGKEMVILSEELVTYSFDE